MKTKEWASWLPVSLNIFHMHSVWTHIHSTAECTSVHCFYERPTWLHFICPLEGELCNIATGLWNEAHVSAKPALY